MSDIYHCLILAISLFLLAGCTGKTAKSNEVEVTPPSAAMKDSDSNQAAAAKTKMTATSESWLLQLFEREQIAKEGGIAIQENDMAISRLELARAADLRDDPKDLQDTLVEELRMIEWMKEKGFLHSPIFRARLRTAIRQAISQSVINHELGEIEVSDEELIRLYETRKHHYTTEEMVHVRMMLLPDDEQAARIMEQLEEGESFGELARQNSRHESAKLSGNLDPFARGTFNREFEVAAFSMDPGQTRQVTTAAGTFIIEKIAHIPQQVTPLDEVKPDLQAELLQEKTMKRLNSLKEEINRSVLSGSAAQ